MAEPVLPKFNGDSVPKHRMIAVLVAGIAAALFAAGLAISAAYDLTQKEKTQRGSASPSPSPSARVIDVELQSER